MKTVVTCFMVLYQHWVGDTNINISEDCTSVQIFKLAIMTKCDVFCKHSSTSTNSQSYKLQNG